MNSERQVAGHATVYHDCRPLKSNWLIKEMFFKTVKRITTNLEWDEVQIKNSYLKFKKILRPELLYYIFKSK